MKNIKITSAIIITLLLLIGCSEGYIKGDYKIKLLLGPINNEHLDNQSINKTIETQLKRLDLYGIPKENIKIEVKDNAILIEINEINQPERIEKILTQQGKIEFWETYNLPEVYDYFIEANTKLRDINLANKKNKASDNTSETDLTKDNLLLNNDSNSLLTINDVSHKSTEEDGFKEFQEQYPLFSKLFPFIDNQNQPIESATVGYSSYKDTSEVNRILKMSQIKYIFPRNMVLAWESKSMDMPTKNYNNKEDIKEDNYYRLIALKAKIAGKPALEGDVIVRARTEVDPTTGDRQISMEMNSEASSNWAIITRDNIGKQIAIVIDGYVYSAPTVTSKISGGKSSISGNFTQAEASDMAIILDAKSLACKLKVLEKEITKIK